jgi:ribosomal protein S18 acetylase RimI-like enzyme
MANGDVDRNRLKGVDLRDVIDGRDPEWIRRLTTATGFFSAQEIDVAVELSTETLEKGEASGYRFLFAERHGRLAGYACHGPIPCTADAFDLYWIAVHPDDQRGGLGRHLLMAVEARIRKAGGARVYVETSHRIQYASTRTFYERCGYRLASVLEDFYAPGDAKATYCKVL